MRRIVTISAGKYLLGELIVENRNRNEFNKALNLAAKEGKLNVVAGLLQAGGDPNFSSRDFYDGRTALHWAAYYNNRALVELLVQHNADPNIKDKFGDSPIVKAVRDSDWKTVNAMVTHYKGSNRIDYGHALLLVVRANQLNTASLLLKANAQTNWHTTGAGYKRFKPLHWAVHNQNPQMVDLLLRYGADEKAENEDHHTPASYAAERQFWDCLQVFVHHAMPKEQRKIQELIDLVGVFDEEALKNKGFLCHISKQIMSDPVRTPRGQLYERAEIEKHIIEKGTCPITNAPLSKNELRPVADKQQEIIHYLEKCLEASHEAKLGFLKRIKNEVNNSAWSNEGIGFFGRKIPDGIERIRKALANFEKLSDDNMKIAKLYRHLKEILKEKQKPRKRRSEKSIQFYLDSYTESQSLLDKNKSVSTPTMRI